MAPVKKKSKQNDRLIKQHLQLMLEVESSESFPVALLIPGVWTPVEPLVDFVLVSCCNEVT